MYRTNGSQPHPTEPLICLRWQGVYAHFWSLPEVWAEEVLRFLSGVCFLYWRMQNYSWKQLSGHPWSHVLRNALGRHWHTHPYLFLPLVLKDTSIYLICFNTKVVVKIEHRPYSATGKGCCFTRQSVAGSAKPSDQHLPILQSKCHVLFTMVHGRILITLCGKLAPFYDCQHSLFVLQGCSRWPS